MLTNLYTIVVLIRVLGQAPAADNALEEARPERRDAWRIGADLDVALGTPVNLAWRGQLLGEALGSLARAQGIALFRDRRVDPDRRVEFAAVNQPLESALQVFAGEFDLGLSRVGDTMYVGPRPTAQRLRTVAWLLDQEARRLSPLAQRPWTRRKSMAWPDGAAPRDLVRALAREAGARVVNLDALPHDLWSGVELPPASLSERFTLVLAGFDSTLLMENHGRILRIVPIPEDVAAERRIPAAGKPATLLAQWQARLPRARVTLEGDSFVLRGLIEDLQGPKPARVPPPGGSGAGQQVYSLTVRTEDEPLEPLLDKICQKLALSLHWDRASLVAAGRRTDVVVSCDVRQGTLDQLLEAVLHPVGLDYRLQDRVVTIIPRNRGE